MNDYPCQPFWLQVFFVFPIPVDPMESSQFIAEKKGPFPFLQLMVHATQFKNSAYRSEFYKQWRDLCPGF